MQVRWLQELRAAVKEDAALAKSLAAAKGAELPRILYALVRLKDNSHAWTIGLISVSGGNLNDKQFIVRFPSHAALTIHMLSNKIITIPTTTRNQTYCTCVYNGKEASGVPVSNLQGGALSCISNFDLELWSRRWGLP